jgi:hypothetical protein
MRPIPKTEPQKIRELTIADKRKALEQMYEDLFVAYKNKEQDLYSIIDVLADEKEILLQESEYGIDVTENLEDFYPSREKAQIMALKYTNLVCRVESLHRVIRTLHEVINMDNKDNDELREENNELKKEIADLKKQLKQKP